MKALHSRNGNFTTKRTKDTKNSEVITFEFLSFVLFVSFAVKNFYSKTLQRRYFEV